MNIAKEDGGRMKNFIGIGRGNAEAALEQATKGLVNPSMILFMTSYEKVEKTAASICEKFPNIPSIGTIGTTLSKGVSGDDNTVILGLFEDAKINCGVIKHLSTAPVAYVHEIEKKIAGVDSADTEKIDEIYRHPRCVRSGPQPRSDLYSRRNALSATYQYRCFIQY